MSSGKKCDFCNNDAVYDGKTKFGPWAFMCEKHFDSYGIKGPGLYSQLKEVITTTKVCSRCNEEKPLSDFYEYTDHSGVPRHRNECKECNKADRKAQRMRKTRSVTKHE